MNSKPPAPLPPLPKHDCNQETPHVLVAKLQNNCLYLGGSFGYASDTSSRDHEFKSSVGPHTGCGICFKTKQNKKNSCPHGWFFLLLPPLMEEVPFLPHNFVPFFFFFF